MTTSLSTCTCEFASHSLVPLPLRGQEARWPLSNAGLFRELTQTRTELAGRKAREQMQAAKAAAGTARRASAVCALIPKSVRRAFGMLLRMVWVTFRVMFSVVRVAFRAFWVV